MHEKFKQAISQVSFKGNVMQPKGGIDQTAALDEKTFDSYMSCERENAYKPSMKMESAIVKSPTTMSQQDS